MAGLDFFGPKKETQKDLAYFVALEKVVLMVYVKVLKDLALRSKMTKNHVKNHVPIYTMLNL